MDQNLEQIITIQNDLFRELRNAASKSRFEAILDVAVNVFVVVAALTTKQFFRGEGQELEWFVVPCLIGAAYIIYYFAKYCCCGNNTMDGKILALERLLQAAEQGTGRKRVRSNGVC